MLLKEIYTRGERERGAQNWWKLREIKARGVKYRVVSAWFTGYQAGVNLDE